MNSGPGIDAGFGRGPYNIEIPVEKLEEYKVWKLLIKVGIKERRLRISPSEIKEIMEDINLSKSEEEYKAELE